VTLVLDASVAAKWFLADERSGPADAILDRIRSGERVVAPALFRWEVSNLFLSAGRAGRIDVEETESALEALRDLPIYLDAAGERFFAGSEMRLAQACGLSAHDAAYLASALNLNAELVTADAPLAQAARDLGLQTTLV
jgi:predicted nucleic acid-binding protein